MFRTKLTIFARLVISYLLLSSMLAGVSLYFIYELNRFNQVTRSIILNDTTILEYANQLSDALLSESRYDRKFVVLKDDNLYNSYLEAKNEFDRLLNVAMADANSEAIQHILYSINIQHRRFNRLVNLERELIRVAKTYETEEYAREKKETADFIIEEIKKIRATSEKNAFTKIVELSRQSDKAQNVSIMISILALSAGLIIAFIITRSIKKPLDVMRAKTVKISRGDFKGDLEVTSPPVIAELASAINTMCHKLQEVDDIKTKFFSHMSHELRTPLASIKEGTSLLLDGLGGDVSENQQRILSIVVQESNRMIELVNSLLDLSKMEAGMMEYQFSSTDIAGLVNHSLETLAPLAEAKNITIENQVGALPPVLADHERMQQVFRNIIGNAIKFTPEEGKIIIDAVAGKEFMEITVHDTGPGIPAKNLELIFHKFQQGTRENGENIKGTGLGLATVQQIIIAHGGKVWATSQESHGTTFHFTLSLASS